MLRRLVKRGAGIVSQPYGLYNALGVVPSTSSPVSEPLVAPRPTPLVSSPWLKFFASLPDRQSSPREQRAEGAEIMRSLNAYAFREHLQDLSNSKMHITFDEMVTLALNQGAATTKDESRALCEALITSGAVFRFRNVIYLSTDDVAEIILSALPDTEAEFKKRIEMIQAELRPYELEKSLIEESATRKSTAILWTGFIALFVQFGVFVWLTFFELSWDFMEPVAYFVSLGNGIVIYLYFLLSHENFEMHTLRDRVTSYFAHREGSRFDKGRYQELTRELTRIQKQLARFCR